MPSSVIEQMQYDTRWRVLLVKFRDSGEVYRYYDVPRAVWEAFVAAPSKGTFLNETFKARGFRYEGAAESAFFGSGTPDSVGASRVLRWPEAPASRDSSS